MNKLEYPKNIIEFVAHFHSNDVCLEYLLQSRWPKGFVCPHCNHQGGWWLSNVKRFQCPGCNKQSSPLSGTLMHRSHLPIRTWFWAAYLVATHAPGISATQLQRQLGIGQIRTAWFLLHRLRIAMVKKDRRQLSGMIELGVFQIGGTGPGARVHGVIKAPVKTFVIGAIEYQMVTDKNLKVRKKVVKLRLQFISALSMLEIKKFLKENIADGSIIKTDLIQEYPKNSFKDYSFPKDEKKIKGTTPHLNRIFENLKEWLNATHHGVNRKYLQSYLNEFVFRFNRNDRPRAAFKSILGILTEKPASPYNKLTNLNKTQKPK